MINKNVRLLEAILLIFLSFSLVPGSNADTSATIDFGETALGAISVTGEVDAFDFAAAEGDVVLAQMTVISGDLDPSIRIDNPDGDTVCSDKTYGERARISTCSLPDAGTYTLYTTDYNGENTGNYQIHLQRLNNPGNTTALAFDETLSGSIAGSAEMDAYTLTGANGDLLVGQLTKTSGDFLPEVRVYDITGDLLCRNHGYEAAFVTDCTLSDDGDYTVLVGDYWGRDTGAYNVYFQKLNEPVGATSLPVAEVKSGTIVAAAEMDAYIIDGSVGDSFIIRMGTTSAGGLSPRLRLYDPNGTEVCSGYSTLDDMAEIEDCLLATDGEHTLLASDYNGSGVGSYDIHLTRINSPVDAGEVAYANLKSAQVSHTVQLHTYTFTGRASDVVVAQAAVPSKAFAPHLRLYNDDGTLICQDHASTAFSENVAWTHCTLPQDDIYVVVFGRRAATSEQVPGTYHLFLQRLTPAVTPHSIRFDSVQSSSFAQTSEVDTYTFRAASGDVATIRMTTTGDAPDPYLRLYGIDGVKLGEDHNGDWQNEAEISECTLPFSGTYTLMVSDYGGNDTGDYSLYLNCEGESCGFPLVLDKKIYLPLTMR